MTTTTEVNLILAQGNAVSEVQNIRKQVLELGQQAIAQKSEDKKKEERAKVQEFREGDRIEIRTEEDGRGGRNQEAFEKEKKPSEPGKDKPLSPSGNLIDIKV